MRRLTKYYPSDARRDAPRARGRDHSGTEPNGIRASRCDDGFSLLEVLIAVVILSVGLLGVMALQANMLSYSHSAYLTSIASIKALDLEERMRANRGVAEDYEFSSGQLTSLSGTPTACNNCGESELVDYDLAVWSHSVRELFPSTVDAELTEDDGVYTLNITWEERERSMADAGESDMDFSYSFRL